MAIYKLPRSGCDCTNLCVQYNVFRWSFCKFWFNSNTVKFVSWIVICAHENYKLHLFLPIAYELHMKLGDSIWPRIKLVLYRSKTSRVIIFRQILFRQIESLHDHTCACPCYIGRRCSPPVRGIDGACYYQNWPSGAAVLDPRDQGGPCRYGKEAREKIMRQRYWRQVWSFFLSCILGCRGRRNL
jgi:hypothetical protein